MMRMVLRVMGAALLLLAGGGAGTALYWRRREAWWQLRTFAQLLLYLQRMVEYRTVPVQSMLQAAATTPQFAELDLGDCHSFAELPLPATMEKVLRDEMHSDLEELATAPRRAVCMALQRMYTICRKESQCAEEKMRNALHLYPRLGVCLGILAAILFL